MDFLAAIGIIANKGVFQPEMVNRMKTEKRKPEGRIWCAKPDHLLSHKTVRAIPKYDLRKAYKLQTLYMRDFQEKIIRNLKRKLND